MEEIPEHNEEEFAQLWAASGEALAQPEFDTSKAWQRMESRLRKRRARTPQRARIPQRALIPLFARLAIAAAVIAAVLTAGGSLFTKRTTVTATGENKK